MKKTEQFCTFYLDQQFYGISVDRVQEIILPQTITSVALAPSTIAGLINLRGQIVTVIDLRILLGMSAIESIDKCMNIVVNTDQGLFSLLVDRIGDALELEQQTSESPPGNASEFAKSVTERVYKLDGALLMILDAQKLVSLDVLVDH